MAAEDRLRGPEQSPLERSAIEDSAQGVDLVVGPTCRHRELQQENIKIQAYNNMSGEFNIMTDQYNNWVVVQKKRIADHNAMVSKLNDFVAGYNAHAQALQGPLNKVLADVGYYQHKCAAGVIK